MLVKEALDLLKKSRGGVFGYVVYSLHDGRYLRLVKKDVVLNLSNMPWILRLLFRWKTTGISG